MPEKKNDVVVLARSGYGMNWNPMFSVNAENNKKEPDPEKWKNFVSLDKAKEQAIEYIREHRAGAERMEYRIKDMATGQILD